MPNGPATPDARGPKERMYDARIAPLMDGIVAACRAAGISLHCHFVLDGTMACTTHVAGPRLPPGHPDRTSHDEFVRVYEPIARGIRAEPGHGFVTVTKPDGRTRTVQVPLA